MRWERERFAVIERVRRTLRRRDMVRRGELVLVAVSGGADSLVLLDALVQLAGVEGISLAVVHVDHGLRPESGEEARFVEEVSSAYGLPCRVVRVEVGRSPAGEVMSPEEAARDARYAAFEEELKRAGASRLATGHTADDRVETLLLRLLAGAGPRGLSSIPPVRGAYIRPLIDVWREEVLAYAEYLPFKPLQDPTNFDLSIPRNMVRHAVLPFLEERFPGARKALLREAETLAEVWEFLDGEAGKAVSSALRHAEEGLELSLEELASLPPALRRESLARVLRLLGLEPTFELIDDIWEKLGINSRGNPSLQLGAGLLAWREYDRLLLGPEPHPTRVEEVSIPGEGVYRLAGAGLELRVELLPRVGEARPWEGDESGPLRAWLDADLLSFPLRVRGIRPGDRFVPLGSEGTRKLQDFLVDLKIPRRLRTGLAVLESGGEIAWVVGVRIDHRFRVTASTRRLAVLTASPA